MKQSLLFFTILFISSAICTETSPFLPPLNNGSVSERAADVLRILKRQNNCPLGYSACSKEGNSGVCCQGGTTCTHDAANNIACCPTGASCTGSLTGTGTSTTSGFMFPQSTSASTTATSPDATITGSTVPGAPYPFVYIPTTFANAETCSSYYSQCQSEFSSCLVSLGGAYGVTVAGAGSAGVTVQGAAAVTAISAAESICSSLSTKACYGLQEGYCTAFGTASATSTGGVFINPSSDATRRSSSLYDLVIALAAGIGGMFL
ncbi:hypothetical protein VTN77DRAFT_6680 [Rasamsonia byssochlamydoides]|uniref:uncharacterized protein n=1 Tax=Rasamsonia byssochlamydoides TaxID=89139 RepID=UPI0037437048